MGIRAGSVRRGSSAARLLSLLPALPIFSVDSAAAAIERSTVATGQAVNQLTESGVLVVRSVGKQRYRTFEATDVTRLDRGLYPRRFAATARVMGENLIRWSTYSPARIGSVHQASPSNQVSTTSLNSTTSD